MGNGRKPSIWSAGALALLAVAARGENVQYSFTYYGQEHGLASSVVRCMTQDRTGFLWVGTPVGLFRWDGFRFRQYTKADGLPDNSVRSLHVDREGTLWAGTTKGIARREGSRFAMASDGGLEVYDRMSIGSDGAGVVYAASRRGLHVRRKGGRFEPLRLGPEIDDSEIAGLWVEEDGALWFGCGKEICRWGGGKLARFGAAEGVPEDRYGGFDRDGRGTLLARGAGGILAQDGHSGRFRMELRQAGGGSLQLLGGTRGRVYAPSWNGLWIRDGGGQWSRITEDNGLPANRINVVWEDHERKLWLGFSDFGIARWQGMGDWKGWTRANGLPSNAISAVLEAEGGRTWVGTREGVTVYDGRGFRAVPELRGANIRAMAESRDGWVWIAVEENGLWRVNGKTLAAERIGRGQGIEPSQILGLLASRDGWLYVSRRKGVWRTRMDGGAVRFEPVLGDILQAGEQIYAMREDGRGRMWLGGTRGILLRDGGLWRRFHEKDGLRDRTVVVLEPGADNEVWFGYGRYLGITRMRLEPAPQVSHFDAGSVLASNDISFLGWDSQGWMWVGTDNGVDVFNGTKWRHIGTQDGLIWHDTVFNAFFAGRGGVWMGTNHGLSRFQPPRDMFDQMPPSVAITGVSVGGRAVDENAPIEAPYARRSVRIGFSSLSFTESREVRYRYRLKGDSDWLETAEREAAFPSLAPGKYEFEVQAGTRSGWDRHSAVVRFRILAPWWRTSWFSIGAILAVVAAGYWFHRRRLRRMQRMREELERAVAERTAELEREKSRVEEQKGEIERLLEQAREVARLKDEFLANVSHEIRTPMNGILGMTSLALQTALRADQREYLECARSSGESLLGLLNDILDFSKIEANRLELESVPFSPRALVEDCVRTVRPSIGGKGIRLEWAAEPDVPVQVMGDPMRVRQILLNLMSNAVKFTHAGFVSVRLGMEDSSGGVARLVFRVIDTGEGIPPEKHKVIFEAFRQADGSTTRRFGGTGLGLAICQRLVALMQGEIALESELGRGSEFTIRIPFPVCGEEQAPAPVKPTPGELGRLAAALVGRAEVKSLRVLVAEDNLINQKLVVRMLERQGHEVEVATDGKQAYMLTGHKHFDLVLMDVQMPELDGLEATRLIREREASTGGRVPILMLTANAMPGDREKCLEAGADAYLSKPVSFDKLTAAVMDLTSVSG